MTLHLGSGEKLKKSYILKYIIALVTESKIEKVESWFNDYPREIIGFKTSKELEFEESCPALGVAGLHS